jgi:hypothetical protein
VGEEVDAAGGIGRRRLQRDLQDAAGAEAHAADLGVVAPERQAGRGRRVVTGTGDHRRVGREAGALGDRGAQTADDRVGGHEARPQPRIEVERRQHLGVPDAVGEVVGAGAGGVARFGHRLARQVEAEVVLRQHDARRGGEGVRVVAAQPQHLGQLEPGDRRVAGALHETLAADAAGDLVDLLGGALVVPQQGRVERSPVGSARHHAVHLPGQGDRRDALAVDRGGDLCERALGGRTPGVGVLLRPTGPWRLQVEGVVGARDDAPRRVLRHHPHARGAEIDAQHQVAHQRSPSSSSTVS